MRIQLPYGYSMKCLLLTRKCPSQNCGKQQVDEDFCVKCSAAVLCSEEEGERGGGGRKCQLLLRFYKRYYTAEPGRVPRSHVR